MEVSQDSKDAYLLTSIRNYFKVGKVYHETRGISKYRLAIREEIVENLIPHFFNYPLGGNKLLQYNIWIEIIKIFIKTPKRSLERDNTINNLIKNLSNL